MCGQVICPFCGSGNSGGGFVYDCGTSTLSAGIGERRTALCRKNQRINLLEAQIESAAKATNGEG
jgi:hypothetical protein